MNRTVLLVLLILLVVLFITGIGLGVTRDKPEGQIDPEKSPIARLAGMLGAKQPLRAGDVSFASSDACLDQFRQQQFNLAPGTNCTLIAGESSKPVRTLTLYGKAGGATAVELRPRGEGGLRVSRTLTVHDTLRLTIREGGAMLRIACAPGSRCVLGTE